MRSRRGWRWVSAVVVALALVAGCGSTPAAPPPTGPLRVLLVNDDGWNAPGIVSLRDALRRAGHEVVQVAPTSPRNDAGTATTMVGDLPVRQLSLDPNVWAVTGTPADATLVGLRSVMARQFPQLVVVGVDPQPTVGLSTLQSGTVGAAMTAASLGIPAVAVSTEVPDARRPRPADFARVNDFMVRLISTMQQQDPEQGPMMPLRTVLNVNYPGGPDAPRQVVLAPLSSEPTTSVFYRLGRRPGTFTAAPVERQAAGGDNDATLLAQGDVTLTDLSADPDRSSPPPRLAARLVPALRP